MVNNNKPKKQLRDYIILGGGPSIVSDKLGVTRKTLWRWNKFGLPDTEHAGRTNYTDQIAKLCLANGHKVSGKHIFKITQANTNVR